jgi:hypothetical protein
MAYYFFTELDKLNNQVSSESYGPVSSNLQTKYKVTSMHTASEEPWAFAVCDGIAFVQNAGNGLVNLILKPISQGILSYASVKYFIYRGITKNSLISNSEIIQDNFNELTQSIWTSNNLLNTTLNLSGSPSEKSLGVHLTANASGADQFLDSDILEKVFYRESNNYQLPIVNAGWKIGKFNPSSFGFEIIVSGPGKVATLNEARISENILDVISYGNSSADQFNWLHRKEIILNYIDPCAFYSLFYHNGIKAKLNSNSNNFDTVKGDNLYNSVLNKFYTKNIIYLDLRNEHNHSLNYYNNYNSGFDIALDGADSSNHSYHDGNYWPIYRINTNSFSGSGAKALITLNLPKGDTDLPTIYLAQGYYKKRYPRNKNKLKDMVFENNKTKDIILATPRHNNNIVLPNYINLQYIKRIVQSPNTSSTASTYTLVSEHFMDNIFDLNKLLNSSGNLVFPFFANSSCKWHITEEEVYIDNSSGNEKGYIAKVCIAEDVNSIYFFAFINGEDLNSGGVDIPIVSGYSSNTNFIDEILSPKFASFEVNREDIEATSSLTISALSDNQFQEVKSIVKLTPLPDSLILLALDKTDDWTELVSALSQLSGNYDKRIIIRDIIELTDINNNTYYEGKIKIAGHKMQSNSIIVDIIDTTIKFYIK